MPFDDFFDPDVMPGLAGDDGTPPDSYVPVDPRMVVERMMRDALTPSRIQPRSPSARRPRRLSTPTFGLDDPVVSDAPDTTAAPTFGMDDAVVDDAPASAPDVPRPRPDTAPKPQLESAPQSPSAPKVAENDDSWEISKGFTGGLIGQNPKMTGNALVGLGLMLDNQGLIDRGQDLVNFGDKYLENKKPRVPSFKDIRTDSVGNFLADVGSYAGYQVGSGVGTSMPSLVAGGLAAATTRNPMVGFALGSGLPSYVQNYGDVFGSLREDPGVNEQVDRGDLTPKDLAEISAIAAVPMAALDVAGVEVVLGKSLFAEAKKSLVKRIAKAVALGAPAEGLTEGLQETISQWTQDFLGSDKPLAEKVTSIIDNALGGFLAGGAMSAGGATLARGGKAAPQPQSEPQAGTQPQPQPMEGEVIPPERSAPAGETPRKPEPTPATQADAEATTAATAPEDAATDEERAMLRAYGYSDEQIDGLSPAQRAAEIADAIDAGSGVPETSKTHQRPTSPQEMAFGQNDPVVAEAPAGKAEAGAAAPTFGENDVVVPEATRERPVRVETPADLKLLGHRVDREPTEAQREAGNHRMDHIRWQGLDISVETPKGGIHRGTAPDGTTWEARMPAARGYIKGTRGRDGEHIDVLFGDHPDSPNVFMIDQIDPTTGRFDEHKAVAATLNDVAARRIYEGTFSDGSGPSRIGGITKMSVDEFKTWLDKGDKRKPIAMKKAPAAHVAAAKEPPAPARLIGIPVERMSTHRVTAADGRSVEVVPVIVEASSLITSADSGFDASLQPRQRERLASRAQVAEIAGGLDPERLGYSAEADRGAPIVGPDAMVESGNGRVMAIRRAYQAGGDAAARYRAHLKTLGVDLSRFREPVLVRQRTTALTPQERQAFTLAANQSTTLSMSATERALADARALDVELLSLLRNPEDLGATANRDFVRAFIARLPSSEQGMMTTAEGALSAEGLTRVRNAIIARAYGGASILTRIAEATDDDLKSISSALIAVAPAWAQLRSDVDAGTVRADMDVTADLVEAVARTADLRAKGVKLPDYLAQIDAFDPLAKPVEGFMKMFYNPTGRRAAGAARITDALRYYVTEARKVSADVGLDLSLPPLSVTDIQALALERSGNVAKSEPNLFGGDGAGVQSRGTAGRAEVRRPGSDDGGAGSRELGVGGAAKGSGEGQRSGGPAEITPDGGPGEVSQSVRRRRPAGAEHPELTFGAGDKVVAIEVMPAGQQMVLPGAERISQAEQARRAAAAPLQPKVAPRPLDEGLFGDESRQIDLVYLAQKKARETGPSDSEGEAQSVRRKRRDVGRAKSRSESFDGTVVDVPGELFADLKLPPAPFWANYNYLARKHPEYFSGPEDARAHVEKVLSDPDVAVPQIQGNLDLIARTNDGDRLIGFSARLRGGRYVISTAYLLDPGQLERMKEGAARAGATVLELNSKGHLSGRGRNEKYNPGDDDLQQSTGRRAPGFYSAVSRAVEGAKQPKASADQWIGMLRNAAGVKPEEMEWLGLEPWLREHKGPVSRDDLLEYVRANQIEVQEVQKGASASSMTEAQRKRWQDLEDYIRQAGVENVSASVMREFEELDAMVPRHGNLGGTKFGSYTLPGGEYYRELLLTLPPTPESVRLGNVVADINRELLEKYGRRYISLAPQAELDRLDAAIEAQSKAEAAARFESPHWKEPNVLAHVRFNDRTIDGKRTLFIEEAQSDWHQKGRREGYRKPIDAALDRRIREIIDKKLQPHARFMRPQVAPDGKIDPENIGTIDLDHWQKQGIITPEERAEFEEWTTQAINAATGIPDAPFKTTWPELIFKRMIRYAAEHGYERIAWTSGKVQSERYDLSRQIESIEVTPRADPQTGDKSRRSLLFKLPSGDFFSASVNKDGIIDRTGASNQEMEGRRLDEVVGKELADKIMNTEGAKTFSGLDLKVGGEGMRGFYDRILPATVNKLVKKFGAKVGHTELPEGIAAEVRRRDDPNAEWEVFRPTDKAILSIFSERENADQYARDYNTVHTLDLTLSLRESALGQGFPLFRTRGRGFTLTTKAAAAQREIADAVRSVIAQLAGPDIAARAFISEKPLEERPNSAWGALAGDDDAVVMGFFRRASRLIAVSLADNPDALATAVHESWHAIEDVLTDQEQTILDRELPRLRDFVRRHRPDVADDIDSISAQEVKAEAAAVYVRLRMGNQGISGLHIAVRRIFEKVLTLLARTRNALAGLGFKSAEDVFEDFARGRMAQRMQPEVQTEAEGVSQAVRRRRPVGPGGMTLRHESARAALHDPTLTRRQRLSEALDALLLPAARALWDQQVDLARLQQAAETAGRTVTENLDAYLAATLYPGRAGERMRDASRDLFEPLFDAMKKHGVSRAELEDYLYARHAPERNAAIRRIDPNNDAGSGMTDGQAFHIMAGFASKMAALREVASFADRIVAHNRNLMAREGLEDAATVAAWQQTYQHYVPLKGSEDAEDEFGTPSTSRGFDVRRAESERALGRVSRADSIMTNLLDQTQRTIIRAEKNRVAKTFLRFAQANPLPGIYKIGLAETRRRISPHTGLVEHYVAIAAPNRDKVFAAKVGGKTHYIEIEHPGILDALKNLGAERMNPFLRAVHWFTRQYSAFQTARNPEFVLTNAVRDIQDAGFTLPAEQKRRLTGRFLSHIVSGRALLGSILGETGKVGGRLGQLYEEWRAAGGKISSFGIKDIASIRREIEAELRQRTEPKAKTVVMAVPRAFNPFGGPGSVVRLLEALSDITESMTRLAVYMAARDVGMTKAQAARASRYATVDFNKKGKYTRALQSLYAFANPSIQGTVKLARILRRSKAARRAAAGLVLLGFLSTLWNLWASPEDDEKKTAYEKRPYWERERNILVYFPGREIALKLPLGYGINVFWMIGEEAAMVMAGKTKANDAIGNVFGTMAQAFNPLGTEGSAFSLDTWAKMISPTITDPIYELATNKNWLGRPIHPREYPWNAAEPKSQQHKVSTNPIAVDVATWLNRVTGGNRFEPGKIDSYPDDIEYVWNFVLGGFGRFIGNTAGLTMDKVAGVDTPVERIPFVRRFVAAPSQAVEREQYYQAANEVTEGAKRFRAARKAMQEGVDEKDAQSVMERLGPQLGVHPDTREGARSGAIVIDAEKLFRTSQHDLKLLRMREEEVRQSKTMSRAERAAALDAIRKEQMDVMQKARRAYREMRSAVPIQ